MALVGQNQGARQTCMHLICASPKHRIFSQSLTEQKKSGARTSAPPSSE
jgi:hypothetical protein